ncbi:hypothetical protein PIB30_048104 [Stylosanthes scabra]|uniref:Uncharacterized protein n=1 Tax=Stylosanthes scabra TaxID=79078 RepID=A0ABU6XEN0_9FABA|nr:hypothetical protein [Stylosanthes scabra]
MKADIPGFANCQACPEHRGVVMPCYEDFFSKFLKMRGQLDLMADVNYWRSWEREGVGFWYSCLNDGVKTPFDFTVMPSVIMENLGKKKGCGVAENLLGKQGAVVREAEAVQMSHELPNIYRWVTCDVLGSPPILDQGYLDELKLTGVIFGGGDLERRYWWRPLVLEIGSGAVLRLSTEVVNRASVAPSQLHPNAWSTIRCFELVTEFLELLQDPEVLLYLFTFFSPNTEGKTKKGYMSVRPGKYRKIFGLYEDSFHDFKGRFFKIFPVSEHRPFWLSLEGQGRFPPYWSRDAGMEYVPVTYKGLNADQDTADILVKLFSEQNLKPKSILGSPSEAREAIVEMAGNEVTLERLRRLIRPSPSVSTPTASIPIPSSFVSPPHVPAPGSTVPPSNIQPVSGGCLSNVGGGGGVVPEVSSPLHEEVPPSPQHLSRKRRVDDASADSKRARVFDGVTREFCQMDRSFDASSFIASNLLGPRAQEVLKDYDLMESIRWAEWASLQATTIMKSIEPRLIVADQWESRCVKLNGDLKALNLQKVEAEKEKVEAEKAKVKAEEDLKSVFNTLKALEKEKDLEVERPKDRETELDREIQRLQKLASDEKARSDKADVSLAESEGGREELIRMAQDSVSTTERALKAQIFLLLPDFDVTQLEAFKMIVDGKIVDLLE